MNPFPCLRQAFIFLMFTGCLLMAGHVTLAQSQTIYSQPTLLTTSEPSFAAPEDLAISPDGGYLLVADTGNNEIRILQPGTLKILSRFGSDRLLSPHVLFFNQQGHLLIIDKGHQRITTYEFNGVYRDGDPNVKHLETQSFVASQHPAVDPTTAHDETGQNYFVNQETHQIEIYDKNQNQIAIHGSGNKASGPNDLNRPTAVETVGRYFWIADSGNNRILLLKAPRPSKP